MFASLFKLFFFYYSECYKYYVNYISSKYIFDKAAKTSMY